MNETYNIEIFFTIIKLIFAVFNIQLTSEIFKIIINVVTGIGSAVIGGVVAVYVARMQIDSNRLIHKKKEEKIERNICIIVISDLEDMIGKFNPLIEEFKDDEIPVGLIQPIIILDSLEKFKSEYFYLLGEDNSIKTISSVINRLKYIHEGLDEIIEKDSIDNLKESCQKTIYIISEILNKTN
ncbi:hypothetical protein SAMN05192559_10487 [Halobacillus karajensis]|uniref:hypothetical protein n=1 Tax=Halobacillus karajensis TaxID=195088 RepID=UPI0008A74216|nr:hypothetical protein [Halobacillus karajensis]SEH78227.1 hypothetical protein SAMN05192559_10487 [Halobacillus karajensis]